MCNNDNPGREKQKMRKMLRHNRDTIETHTTEVQQKLMRSLVERRIEETNPSILYPDGNSPVSASTP